MNKNLEMPIEQLEESTIKFDLANLRLEFDGLLARLKGNSDALIQLHELITEASQKCYEAMAELEPVTPSGKERRIPHVCIRYVVKISDNPAGRSDLCKDRRQVLQT
jgi:hypothetical protein